MHNLDTAVKNRIVEIVRRGVPSIIPKGGSIAKACLYHAEAVRQVLQGVIDTGKLHRGVPPRILIQAGSHSWMRIKPEEDDGKIATHFSYEWQGGSVFENLVRVMIDDMPEMHVWNALFIQGHPPQIIDLTTRYLPEQAQNSGITWTAPKPPDYLWCTASEIPATTIYHPKEEATKLAYQLIGKVVDSYNPILPIQ